MALLLGIFVMIFPAEASADVSKESDVVWGSGGNFINSVEYSESSDGKIIIKTDNIAWKAKGDNLLFCAVNSNGKVFVREKATQDDIEGSLGVSKYTFKTKFTPGTKIKIGGYVCTDAGLSDADIIKDAVEIELPEVAGNPYDSIEDISLGKGVKSYSGKIVNENTFYQKKIYRLKATDDCMINITDFKSSDNDATLTINECDGTPSPQNKFSLVTDSYNNVKNSRNSLKKFALRKGTYYIEVEGANLSTYSFKMEFRKYVHAKIKWSIKEGDINSSFPQNKTLHVAFEITNKNSDAYLDSNNVSWSAAGTSGNKVKVSKNKRKGTFTYKTYSQPIVDTVTIFVKELNKDEKNEDGNFNKPNNDSTRYTLDIATGMSETNFEIVTGPNYIMFPSFRGTEFVDDGSTTVTVYLKSGSKWKKKFTAKAGSRDAKTIKKLKPNKKYQLKIVTKKKIKKGNKTKTVKNSKVVKVKTGPKTAPSIKSAVVTNYKKEKVWNSGHFDGNGLWHPGNWMTNTSYTMTITLNKPVKGCKGISYAGKKCKGTGTTFSFFCQGGDPPSKTSVKGYSDEKYYGYTKESNSVSVSRQ